MADLEKIRAMVNSVVSEILDVRMAEVRDEIARRVLQEVEPLVAAVPGASSAELLETAVSAVHAGTSQSEILAALLEGAAMFSGRAALFIVRGSTAAGWQGRGFRDNEAVRTASIDVSAGLAASCVQERGLVSGTLKEFDARFAGTFGDSMNGACVVLPLVVGNKAAALLYADGGTGPELKLDGPALQMLTRSASLWVELLALRKATGASVLSHPSPAPRPVASVPIAAPLPAAASQHSAVMSSVLPPALATGLTVSAPSPAAIAAIPTVSEIKLSDTVAVADRPYQQPPPPDGDGDEDGVHRKARRFAKLLVDEIKLYNQHKVMEGRQKRDLYDRLREDLEKSRAAYDKRYANTSAAAGDYFTREVIRNLADNNPALLGNNFPR